MENEKGTETDQSKSTETQKQRIELEGIRITTKKLKNNHTIKSHKHNMGQLGIVNPNGNLQIYKHSQIRIRTSDQTEF